jgi:hypothetical protein
MLGLILQPAGSEAQMAALYKRAFSEATELYLATAYLRLWDKKLVLNKRCQVFKLFVGKDLGITRKQACLDVLSWLPGRWKTSAFFMTNGIEGFHPKVLFWKTADNKAYGVIGSSNLSSAAWTSNYEANVYDEIPPQYFTAIEEWMRKIEDESTLVTRLLLKTYKETPSIGRRARGVKPKLADSDLPITLPKFSGMMAIAKDRKRRLKSFKRIRPKLTTGIHRCALGEISNKEFYDILQSTWGTGNARVQGWGWHVKGRTSNFRELCRGLDSIITSNPKARDTLVVDLIDRLRTKKVPTRRSLLSELLCLYLPNEYPILNEPVASYLRGRLKPPYGSSEGAKYLYIAISFRASLKAAPGYKARNLFELDGMIWEYQRRLNQAPRS